MIYHTLRCQGARRQGFVRLKQRCRTTMPAMSLREQVIVLINEANLSDTPEDQLVQAQEILLRRDRSLLGEFLEHMLDFQVSRRITGRRFTAQFAEAVVKQRSAEFLSPAAECLLNLLSDESPGVLKYAIRAAGEVFRRVLHGLCAERGAVSAATARQWTIVSRMKDAVFAKVVAGAVRSTNDGVRTQSIRFIENVVLMYSDVGPGQTEGRKRAGLSLQSVPAGHAVLNRKALREEGGRILEELIALLSAELSSSNYQVLIYVLGAVAKERVPRADSVMPHILKFCLTPPEHLKPQPRKSTDKACHLTLSSLAKTTDSVLKRWQTAVAHTLAGKTPTFPAAIDLKIGQDDELDTQEEAQPGGAGGMAQHRHRAKELLGEVGQHGMVDLVLSKFTGFPSGPPPEGASALDPRVKVITPIAAFLKSKPTDDAAFEKAAAAAEKELLQLQIEADNVAAPQHDPHKRKQMEDAEAMVAGDGPASKLARSSSTVAGVTLDVRAPILIQASAGTSVADRPKPAAQAPAAKRKRPHVATVTVDYAAIRTAAWKRLMSVQCQVGMEMAGAGHIRLSQLARLGVQQDLDGILHQLLVGHIAVDFHERQELAIEWLFHEFTAEKVDVHKGTDSTGEERVGRYEKIMLALLRAISDAPDISGSAEEAMTERLLEQCPQVTPGAVDMLKAWCEDPAKVKKGMRLLKQLILERPTIRHKTLEVLLAFTHHHEAYIREPAVRLITHTLFRVAKPETVDPADDDAVTLVPQVQSTCRKECTGTILVYANACLGSLIGETDGKHDFPALPEGGPTEDIAKQRIDLYLALCTQDPSLLQRSLDVFVASNTPTKRMISIMSVRVWATIAQNFNTAPMEKLLWTFPVPDGFPYIQAMLSKFGQGAAPPSLVSAVKKVYAERDEVKKDVRLLTPFLDAHSKDEIIEMLPHLVQLLKRQNGAKQLTNALNGLFASSPCPLPPADLLIALHSVKDEPRQVAKAIEVCLKDLGRIFNFTVLAKVLTKLVESTPLPQLFMVTFITAMRDCPKLAQQSGPAVQVLKRCVDKKIWTTPLWKGFLRCIKDYRCVRPQLEQ